MEKKVFKTVKEFKDFFKENEPKKDYLYVIDETMEINIKEKRKPTFKWF